MLVLCAARLRRATRTLLLDDPRVTALLDRMAAPAIETAADAPERPFVPTPLGDTSRHGDARWHGARGDLERQHRAERRCGVRAPRARAERDPCRRSGWRAHAERRQTRRSKNCAATTAAASSFLRARGSRRCWSSRISSPRCASASAPVRRSSWHPSPNPRPASTPCSARRGRAQSHASPIRACTSKPVPREPAALRDRRPSEQRQEQHRCDARRRRNGRDFAGARHDRRGARVSDARRWRDAV